MITFIEYATIHPDQYPRPQRPVRYHPPGGSHRLRIRGSDRTRKCLRPGCDYWHHGTILIDVPSFCECLG